MLSGLRPFLLCAQRPAKTGLAFRAAGPPWVRSDYDELQKLAHYLAETTGPQDRIAIAGSSFTFNQDIVQVRFLCTPMYLKI